MIRAATHDDLPRLVEMGRKFHAKAQDKYSFVEEDCASFFAGYIGHGIVLIAPDGFLAGVIAGAPSNASYKTAFEIFWWSESRSGLALKRAFERWGVERGCQESVFSHPVGEDRPAKILARSGYEPETLTYRKALPCV